MKAQSPLITLRNLAQEAVEQAAQRLGQARQAATGRRATADDVA